MSETKAVAPPAPPSLNIYQAIPRITGDVAPIAKLKENSQQGYKFRGIDDVYGALNLLLAKYGVSVMQSVLESHHDTFTTAKGSVMFRHRVRIRYTLYAADGSHLDTEAEGEGMDTGDKATPKAFSTAYKTMAFELFCIPTGDKKLDTEEDSPEVDAAGTPETTAAETERLRKAMQSAATVEKREEVAKEIHAAREAKKITEQQAVSLRPDYLAKMKEQGPAKAQVTNAAQANAA